MRVGLSVNFLEPRRNQGRLDGIGIYTKHLFDGLSSQGTCVVPFSFPGFTSAGSPVVGRSLRVVFPVAAAAAMSPRGWIRFDPDVDVYHVTDYRVVPMRCPVVATLHDAIPMIDPSMSNFRFRQLKNYVLRNMARHADLVIAISVYSVAELVEHYRIDEARIRVVHCGVDETWLQPPSEEAVQTTLAARGLTRGYFLSVGTLQPRKNIGRVIAAHDLLPRALRTSCPLVVVGRPGWRCDDLIELLRRKQLSGEAKWLSDVADMGELRALYAGAGTFVFPSLYEGFGLPVLEAFASGVPVITSTVTSLPEVSAGIAREVDPVSVEAIADAMRQSISDDVDRSARVSAGYERARAMTWGRMAERVRDVYRELC